MSKLEAPGADPESALPDDLKAGYARYLEVFEADTSPP